MFNKRELNGDLELEYESLSPTNVELTRHEEATFTACPVAQHRALAQDSGRMGANEAGQFSPSQQGQTGSALSAELVSKSAPDAGAELPDSCMGLPPGPRNPTCREGLDRLPSIRASESPGPGSLLLSPWPWGTATMSTLLVGLGKEAWKKKM